MLQTIHQKIQGWFATAIISLIVVTFALFGIQSYLNRNTSNSAVAKVNGSEITNSQLQNVYQILRQSAHHFDQKQLREQALQQLIQATILAQAAIQEGYHISPIQVDALIMQLPAFQENGRFSMERFQRILQTLRYSQAQFLTDFQNNLLVNQAQIGVTQSAFALTSEAEQMLELLAQQRDILYTLISAASLQSQTSITPEMINAYYQQHQDQFKTPEKVSIEYLELNVNQLAKKVQITDADIQQYYQDNQGAYIKDGKPLPLAQVKTQIEKGLTQQKLQELFSAQSQQLADLTFTHSATLIPAANALGLTIQHSDFFSRQGEESGIASKPGIIAAAFNEDVLKNKNNSNVITIGEGDVIVLRVKNYQPATVLPLAQVKPHIVQQLQVEQSQKAAEQQGEKMVEALQSGHLASLTQQYHLHWQTKNRVTRQASGIDGQIIRTAFALGAPQNDANPRFTGVTLQNGDYVIVGVKKVWPAVSTPKPQQITVTQHQLENNYGQLDYQLYINELLDKSKVKIYS